MTAFPPEPMGERKRVEAAAPPTPAPLNEEVAALDEVRSALAARAPTRALALLQRFGELFPNPMLAEEAAVLRVDALGQKGDRSAAAQLSREVLAANPGTPHAPHLRAVIEAAPIP